MPQFYSSSKNIDVAESFRKQGNGSVILIIESKAGKDISQMAYVFDEEEVVFKTNSKFEVMDIDDTIPNSPVIITLKEID